MIDIRLLRSDPEQVKKSLARRGIDLADLDRALEIDEEFRKLVSERDETRAKVKSISAEVGEAKRSGDETKAEDLAKQSRSLGDHVQALDANADHLEEVLRDLLLGIPNVPSDQAPDGRAQEDNVVIRTENYNESNYTDHPRIPHWDIGEKLGILDMERAAKLSGSMFSMFRGRGATLARALCQFALDNNADLYEEVRPPTLVKTETMTSTGHLPKFEEDAYHLERDDLWAIPTAEVPLTSLARDEILTDLPMRLMAYTSCFRREAGSAGRDTRGLLRVHEFDKVELLAYCIPEQTEELHKEILTRAENLLTQLGLAYRVVDLCAGDLGNSSARTFDIETYAPGCDMWLEVSSVSWFSDYQARRANVRYKTPDGKTAFVHTLNGSALAVPRVWASLVETNYQADGTINIPKVLQPYMNTSTISANGK